MPVSRRALVLSCALPLAALAASAFTLSASATVKLQYWGRWDEEKALVAKFNQEHKGQIEVEFSTTDPAAKLTVAVAGGAPPDIVNIDRFKNGSWASSGMVMSLEPFIKADKVNPKDFWSATWAECVYKGAATCIPFNTDARALFYNKEIFSEAGLDPTKPPSTWDQVIAYSNKIDRRDASGKYTRVGFNPMQGNFGFLGWLWAAGGDLLSKDDKTVTWNDEKGIQTASFITDQIRHYGGNIAAGMGELQNGTAGMVVDGSWNIGPLVHTAGADVKWAAAGAPRPAGLEGEPTTWSGGFALAIPAGAKHPKESWEVINWMTQHQNETDFGAQTGQIPARISAAHDMKFYALNNLIPVFVKVLEYSHFRPVLPDGAQMWDIYAGRVNSGLSDAKLPPKQILDQTAELGQIELDKGWSIANGTYKAPVFPKSGDYQPVDITKLYNNNGISTLKDPSKASLDGGCCSLAGEALPDGGKVQTIAGIPFNFPKIGDTLKDNIAANGKALDLPNGKYNAIYLLATAVNGGQSGLATANYTDGSKSKILLGISDWCGSASFGEKNGPRPDYRHNAKGKTTPSCGMYVQGVGLDSGKTLDSITLPDDDNMHIFAVTLGKK
ncbi:MAG TPA: ABC transporter substrate-binding protein [Limnochordia bacterium]|nr:ABC transporter substrate-binding protein [Limnochordia bacterium]